MNINIISRKTRNCKENIIKKRAKQPYSNDAENNYEEPDIIKNQIDINDINKNKPKEEIIPVLSPNTIVTITITPGINNFKRIDLPQHTYYFSNTSLVWGTTKYTNKLFGFLMYL